MSHRSRLSQARSELGCIVCGCTEENPCILTGPEGNAFPCTWISPGLCSNPECGAAFEAEYGAGVPEIRDSRYMGKLDDFAARRAEDFTQEFEDEEVFK